MLSRGGWVALLALGAACGKSIAVRDASEARATLAPAAPTDPTRADEQGRAAEGFRCAPVRGDLGDCETVLGYGFDGARCREFRGCDCGSACDQLTADPLLCASTCSAAGKCDEAAIHASGLAQGPVRPGSFCDEVTACAHEGTALAAALPRLDLTCEVPGFPCASGQRCHLQFQGPIHEEGWLKICGLSLLPGADLHCVLWGP